MDVICAVNCDASGLGGPTCGDIGGPGSQYKCILVNELNSDPIYPNEWGVCINCDDWPSGTFTGCG